MSDSRGGVQLSDEQRIDWLRLIRSQNIGPRTFRALLNHCGGARAALEALPALARRGGGTMAPKICSRAEAEREIEVAERCGAAFIALGEADYPHHGDNKDRPIEGNAPMFVSPQAGMDGLNSCSC